MKTLSRFLGHPRAPLVAMLLLIAAAHLVPRIATLHGISYSAQLVFGDMPLHLLNLHRRLSYFKFDYLTGNDYFFSEAPQDTEFINASRWPQGVYFVAMPFAGLFGPLSIWTVQITNLLFQGVLVLGIILLGRRLTGGLSVGLWGALLTVLCPPLAGATWYLNLDFPLAATTVLSLAMLLHTEGFTRTRASAIFGLVSALALYTKLSFPLYLLFPSLWALVHGLRQPGPRRRVLLNLGLALLVFIGISAALGNFHLLTNLEDLRYHSDPSVRDEALPSQVFFFGTLEWALAEGRFLVNSFTWPLSLLLLPVLALLLSRRVRALPALWPLLLYVAGTYVVFTLIHSKLERYLQPVYPVLCLLIAWWISRTVPRRWVRVALVWTATLFASVLWLTLVLPLPWRVGPWGVSQEPMFYDLRPPTDFELHGLRRLQYDPRCDLRPLVRVVEQLSSTIPRHRVLSVAHLGTPKDELFFDYNMTYDTLASILTQQFPDNLVINTSLNPVMRPPPYTLVLHEPDKPVGSINPSAKVIREFHLTLTCPEPHRKVLSLLKNIHDKAGPAAPLAPGP